MDGGLKGGNGGRGSIIMVVVKTCVRKRGITYLSVTIHQRYSSNVVRYSWNVRTSECLDALRIVVDSGSRS